MIPEHLLPYAPYIDFLLGLVVVVGWTRIPIEKKQEEARRIPELK